MNTTGKAAAVVVPLLGVLAVIVGTFAAWLGGSQPVGWFAYAPLANETFSPPGFTFIGPMTQAGLVSAVVGLLLLAFWAGHRVGRRR
ncbi:hypothetical protein [Arthrobacter silvisoli]|uniref:hypothetical protein n=1 Tax=Arthrobacter silvisoli TaxID=2291022 RepID=UPI001FE2B072|nr:hypothetical protein [Arthrobacter silvisoli]